MNERELGKALLTGEPVDARTMTQNVLRRDRRRMWILGTLCVLAWMLVVMLPWSTALPMLAQVAKFQQGESIAPGPTPMTQAEQTKRIAKIVETGTIVTFIGSLASMLLAAVCTVLFITLSRRATLRQFNARLTEISDQLKLLTKT